MQGYLFNVLLKARYLCKKSIYKMDLNSKLMLQAKPLHDWCITSSANFCIGVTTKKKFESPTQS